MAAEAPRFAADVSRYLADCAAAARLERKYHPTAAGALKVIYHRTDLEEAMIRREFARLHTGAPR